jgi:hypothetical protein
MGLGLMGLGVCSPSHAHIHTIHCMVGCPYAHSLNIPPYRKMRICPLRNTSLNLPFVAILIKSIIFAVAYTMMALEGQNPPSEYRSLPLILLAKRLIPLWLAKVLAYLPACSIGKQGAILNRAFKYLRLTKPGTIVTFQAYCS